MRNYFKALGWSGALVALVALGQTVACSTQDDNEGEDTATGGTSGSEGGTGGTASSSTNANGTAGSTSNPVPSNTVCSGQVVLGSATSEIASFDDYVDGTALADYSYTIGTTSVYTGPFVYGDDHTDPDTEQPLPESGGVVAGGYESTAYALNIADTDSADYGGGLGIWIDKCLDARAFSGIVFYVKGSAPTGEAKLTLVMEETTTANPDDDASPGTCDSTDNAEGDCIHPSYSFPVEADWTEVKVPWGAFSGGMAMGAAVAADGNHIKQLQIDVGLSWADDGTGTYVPEASSYDFSIDSIAFY